MSGPLVIIDGHNLFIRSFVVNSMMDVNGNRCGGAVGTVNSVKKLLNDLKPSNVLLVWDGEGGSQRRKQLYSAYKEGRTVRMNKSDDDMEDDSAKQLENLRLQRQNAQDYLTMLGIPQIRCDGVEADDLIAFVAGKMDHPNGCVIVTTDKDMLQLIQDGAMHTATCDLVVNNFTGMCDCSGVSEVKVLSPVKQVLYDRMTFISEHGGILPENYRLVKALTGDKSDNVAGIKGYGEATALKLFPDLAVRPLSPNDLLHRATELTGYYTAAERLLQQEGRFRENLTLMDLSEPMLSATASRQAREAMYRDLGCKELELRIRLNKDGVGLLGSAKHGDTLVQVFKDFVLRRRKLLATINASAEGEGE